MSAPLAGRRVLLTGIVDAGSLAVAIGHEVRRSGGTVVCTGLGPTPHHAGLSEKAARFLASGFASFQATVRSAYGAEVPTLPLDVTLDASLHNLGRTLAARGLPVDGVVHSIAMDKTIRGGSAKPLLEVTREEFLSCLDVSAYSLLALVRSLLEHGVLARGASVVALSYLGAERLPVHPYKNVGVAKAALERIAKELAGELGPRSGVRVNAVRFSPFAQSRAGGAIEGLREAVALADARSPLGNARPEDLAAECVHLLRPDTRITGEIRNVDGGYHILG